MTNTKIDFKNMDLGFDEINPESSKHELVYKKININQLDENPENNKIYEYDKEADEFLKEDIKRNGILNPIVILKSETHAGRYMIVSGHRRTRIAKILGIFELEAREIIARTPEEKAFAQIMLITANSTQRDRKPSEKAREVQYLKSLMQDNDSIDNLAKWISNATKMSERNVYRYEKLAEQPREMQEAVDKGELSVKQAIGEIKSKKKNPTLEEKTRIDILKMVINITKDVASLRKMKDENGNEVFDEKSEKYIKEMIEDLKEMLVKYTV
ncbi:MAG: ParB N-terminal domain-containing protein [Clostridia bacterium]|nr:ParB N-terminal domain-containing protein [Clostridia bacterium]